MVVVSVVVPASCDKAVDAMTPLTPASRKGDPTGDVSQRPDYDPAEYPNFFSSATA